MHLLSSTSHELHRVLATAHLVPRPDKVWRIEGPAAIACLQGIFTNDLIRSGPDALTWGAVLTPKGMILSDLWIRREGESAVLVVPETGAPALAELFRKSFPPRLARLTDLSGSLACSWLTALPAEPLPGAVMPWGPAPFAAMLLDGRTTGGVPAADPVVADALRLLQGWPVLGREIDERTLVQEVRFDELEGVRYDKGCYVGQETVARLHFRGHPNRTLRAVVGSGPVPDTNQVTARDGRDVGVVATLLTLDDRWIGSVKLRREVETGAEVGIGIRSAHVAEFPVVISTAA